MLGKAVSDFRRATNEFRLNLEREVDMEGLKETIRPVENAPHPEALARGLLAEAVASTTPAAPAAGAPEKPASSEDPSSINGGTGSIH